MKTHGGKRDGAGRPAMSPEGRKSHKITFRLNDALKVDIESSAVMNGRTISEEVIWRLTESFAPEREACASYDARYLHDNERIK